MTIARGLWVCLVATSVGASCGGAPKMCEAPGTQVTTPRAAGCFVVRDDTLLMVKAGNGRWSIPAGYVEPGEAGAAAAIRETREEAGVTVSAGAPVCAVESSGFVAYRCTLVDGTPTGDGTETSEARFVPRSELSRLWLRFPEQRETYLSVVAGRQAQ